MQKQLNVEIIKAHSKDSYRDIPVEIMIANEEKILYWSLVRPESEVYYESLPKYMNSEILSVAPTRNQVFQEIKENLKELCLPKKELWNSLNTILQ